jgi:CarD family transcriptional regulator
MDYQPGDYVVHPIHGVGQIVSIQVMEFVENKQTLFYQVGFEGMTVWVQVEDHGGLRALTTKADLYHYRRILESPPESLGRDFRDRKKKLEARLQNHSFQILCEVVRDLYALSKEKTLNNYESRLFRNKRLSLQQEWAFSSGIPVEEMFLLIDEMLQKSATR